MTEPGSAVLAALVCAAAMFLLTRPVLVRLPEPAPLASNQPESEQHPDKVPYAAVATRRFALGCAALSAVAVGFSWPLVAVPARPPWVVLGTVALLLAAVDARTTWLPLRLTQVAWLTMAAAMLLGAGLAGFEGGATASLAVLLQSAVGAAIAGVLYLLIWWLTRGGFGFGDVRFAPVVGAATASVSLTSLLWALVLGSVLGGVYGIVRLVRRRPGQFPYAPAMLAGAYLALVVRPVTG